MLFRAPVFVAALHGLLSLATPAWASIDLFGGDHRVRAPQIAAAPSDAVSYHVVFAARPSSTFGHSFIDVGAIAPGGRRHRTVVFGFYPAAGADDAISVLVGTRGEVGYTSLDIHRPTVAFRFPISEAKHRKLQGWTRHVQETWRHFDLVRRNCNHLVGHVARSLGLTVPADSAQSPEAFVRELEGLNAQRAGRSSR
jgi:hypothetical protein